MSRAIPSRRNKRPLRICAYSAIYAISGSIEINPEDALRKTISKFIHRFRYIEEHAENAGKSLNDMTLEEMEALWQKSKGRQPGGA